MLRKTIAAKWQEKKQPTNAIRVFLFFQPRLSSALKKAHFKMPRGGGGCLRLINLVSFAT